MSKLIVFNKFLIVSVFVYFAQILQAQVSPKDSIVSGFIIDIHYGFHMPGGDLDERFGNSSSIGPGVFYKDMHNWFYGLELNYVFGGDVKIQDSIFKNLYSSDGYIIDGNGLFAEVFTYERGWIGMGKVGKVIPLFGPNDNCGPFLMLGAGYMTHKIRIYNQDMTAPQIKDEYKKGYDRLTGGLCLSQQLGYMHIGNRKAYSFSVSFEITEAFTKPLRDYQFDLMGPEPQDTRLDLLYGIRFSWMIPLFRQPSDIYFTD